jgi:hypothetical protein
MPQLKKGDARKEKVVWGLMDMMKPLKQEKSHVKLQKLQVRVTISGIVKPAKLFTRTYL